MPALSFSEIGNSNVLPLDKPTSTGGNIAQFESKQAGGKSKKNKKSAKKPKSAKKRTAKRSRKSVKKSFLAKLKFW
jgi:hypothetical protein